MNVLLDIDPKKIQGVYSGKHGCACGCRGNHSDNPATVKLIVGKIIKAFEAGDEVDVNINSFNPYIAAQTATRLYIAYLEKQ